MRIVLCFYFCESGSKKHNSSVIYMRTILVFSNYRRGCDNRLAVAKGGQQGKSLRTTDLNIVLSVRKAMAINLTINYLNSCWTLYNISIYLII